MIYIESNSRDAAFHFGTEELCVQQLIELSKDNAPREDAVLMLWQTKPTVMLGANQVAEIEVNLEYAKQNGIEIIRLSSGGGAIYTDEGTIQYTIMTPYDIKEAFQNSTDIKEASQNPANATPLADNKRIQTEYLAKPIISALASGSGAGNLCLQKASPYRPVCLRFLKTTLAPS